MSAARVERHRRAEERIPIGADVVGRPRRVERRPRAEPPDEPCCASATKTSPAMPTATPPLAAASGTAAPAASAAASVASRSRPIDTPPTTEARDQR